MPDEYSLSEPTAAFMTAKEAALKKTAELVAQERAVRFAF